MPGINVNQKRGDFGSGSSEYIKLKVIDQYYELYFLVKINCQMWMVKKAYCDRMEVPVHTLRFEFGSRPIKDDDTPLQLKMENGDEIDVCDNDNILHLQLRFKEENH